MHTGGAGVVVAGNFVPWGSNLCLTPSDAISYVDLCNCGEGFECPSLYCDYLKIVVNYTEYNEASSAVEGPYTNQVWHFKRELEGFCTAPVCSAPMFTMPLAPSHAPKPKLPLELAHRHGDV